MGRDERNVISDAPGLGYGICLGIGVEGHGREIPTQHSISQSL
jgi:hypothetical protein